jgi:hypothetical protein
MRNLTRSDECTHLARRANCHQQPARESVPGHDVKSPPSTLTSFLGGLDGFRHIPPLRSQPPTAINDVQLFLVHYAAH